MFSKDKDFEIVKHGVESILKINYLDKNIFPSIEDSALVMRDTVKRIVQTPSVTKIIFTHNKNYEYDYDQVSILKEIADLYSKLSKEKTLFTTGQLISQDPECVKLFFNRYSFLQNTIIKDLPSDPIGAFVRLKRKLRDYKFEKTYREHKCLEVDNKYENALNYVIGKLETLTVIKGVKDKISGHKVGDRHLYKEFFNANIKPNFIYTSLLKQVPIEARELDTYNLSDAKITIYELDNESYNLYHVTPVEFTLSEEKYNILNLAKEVISEHQPESNDFIDPQRLREVFFNIAKDLIEEIAEFKGVDLKQREVEQLSNILIKYTVGFGMVETLLEDENIQDISINAPSNKSPIFITHGQYEDCKTNIIPEEDEVEGWASRLRMISGKPLDASNPILDTEIETPHARSRVSVVGKPLNSYGLGFSFRRHRDKPWTLPLFIKNGMISAEAAGLLSFIVDGSRTMLIAGTRGSGKSSFLTAVMIEIMRKYRIITVEDSVTGDCEVIYQKDKKTVKTTFEELFKSYKKSQIKIISKREIIEDPQIKINTVNSKGIVEKLNVDSIVRHKVSKTIYEIKTSTGRIIKVTGDHSLFTLGDNKVLEEIKTNKLKVGKYIATPRKTLSLGIKQKYFEITKEDLKEYDTYVELNKYDREEIIQRAKEQGISKSTYNVWFRKNSFPLKVINDETITKIKISKNSIITIPNKILLDKEFLEFVGLWIADGCYDKNSVIMSVSSNEEIKLVNSIAKRFGMKTTKHSDKFSLMINSKTLKFIMSQILDLDGNAYTKKIPNWIFNLSKEQTNSVLKGLFSGDGCVGKYEIIISLASEQLLKDIQTLMLNNSIVSRINYREKTGKVYPDRTKDLRISGIDNCKKFEKEVGFIQNYKNEALKILTSRTSTHDNSDIIPLSVEVKNKLNTLIRDKKIFNSNDYIKRNNSIGRRKLNTIAKYLEKVHPKNNLTNYIVNLSQTDIYWDKIIEINKINKPQFVYDLCVPGNENFISNNILAHNTLEIPTIQFADLGYNIQSMSVRSALSVGNEGLSADMGIRSSLRLGDSCLIVGEVRSKEALALYEAMRVGALANVVAGTIHGDTPYGVYDRLVNDLGVPNTSFKATDIIIVANPVKSSDGLRRTRRITKITEVRKKWEKDPELEGGFMDLFSYDSETDRLEISDDLKNGDSDVLKAIGGSVKQWAGNWDAIWDNIVLRGKVKQMTVDFAKKYQCLDLLEAKAVIDANDMFHKISQKISEETGTLDSKKILREYEEWFKHYARNLAEKSSNIKED